MRTTAKQVEIVFDRLCKLTGNHNGYTKECPFWELQRDISGWYVYDGEGRQPLGGNRYTTGEMFDMLWVAIYAIQWDRKHHRDEVTI
jgi:hypothetical protein